MHDPIFIQSMLAVGPCERFIYVITNLSNPHINRSIGEYIEVYKSLPHIWKIYSPMSNHIHFVIIYASVFFLHSFVAFRHCNIPLSCATFHYIWPSLLWPRGPEPVNCYQPLCLRYIFFLTNDVWYQVRALFIKTHYTVYNSFIRV